MGYDYNKMKQLIEQSGMTQKKFFSKLGLSEKIFTDWVSGSAIPREDVAKKMAKLLGVSLHDLRDGSDTNIAVNPAKPTSSPKTKVFVSNFAFFREDKFKLYSCCNTAERLFLSGFHTQSVTQLGMFGEFLVEDLLADLHLDDYFGFNHYERIKILFEEGHIHLRWYEILDKLRLIRNNILHEHTSVNETAALNYLKQAFELAKWFAFECDIAVENSVFVTPFKSEELPKEATPAPAVEQEIIVPQVEKCDYIVVETTDGACITSYMGTDSNVVIPEEIQGKQVVAIGERAFQNCTSLEKVTIATSIHTIEDCAFAWCSNLKEVCGVQNIEKLGKRVFYRCSSLEHIESMPLLKFMPKEAFAGCVALKTFEFSRVLVGIAGFAFSGCAALQEFSAHDGLTVIGERAFSDCISLKKIDIPDSVTIIGEESFFNCASIEILNFPFEADRGYNAFGFSPSRSSEEPVAAPTTTTGKNTERDRDEAYNSILSKLDTITQIVTTKYAAEGTKMTLVEYLEYRGLEVIDKRGYGGCLWVVGTEDEIGNVIDDAKEIFEVGGTYCGGGRATSYRPGWFSRAKTSDARLIPVTSIEIDYDEVAPAGELYEKYFGKINGLLILEDEEWTNDYCFVVDGLSEDGKKLDGVCYCNGKFKRYFSYYLGRKFKVFNGETASDIAKIHNQYKKTT